MHVIEVNRNFALVLHIIQSFKYIERFWMVKLDVLRQLFGFCFYSALGQTIFTRWFAATSQKYSDGYYFNDGRRGFVSGRTKLYAVLLSICLCHIYDGSIRIPVFSLFPSLESMDFIANGYQLICITCRRGKKWIKRNQNNGRRSRCMGGGGSRL